MTHDGTAIWERIPERKFSDLKQAAMLASKNSLRNSYLALVDAYANTISDYDTLLAWTKLAWHFLDTHDIAGDVDGVSVAAFLQRAPEDVRQEE